MSPRGSSPLCPSWVSWLGASLEAPGSCAAALPILLLPDRMGSHAVWAGLGLGALVLAAWESCDPSVFGRGGRSLGIIFVL